MSLVEAIANVAVGYGVAVVTQTLVFPLFGLTATLAQNLGIGAIFTAVSLVRSYALRRAFEAIRQRPLLKCAIMVNRSGLMSPNAQGCAE